MKVRVRGEKKAEKKYLKFLITAKRKARKFVMQQKKRSINAQKGRPRGRQKD